MTQSTAKPEKKIRTRWIRLLAAAAALLTLFSVAFWGVSALLEDTSFIDEQYTALGTSEEMGISVPDLSRATVALFDYMKGRRDSIRISVRQNGQEVDDLFYHPKEVVHMEEVRDLWRTLVVLSVFGIAVAGGCIAAIIFFGHRNNRIRATGTGLIAGSLAFAGIILAALLWAVSDFQSFWTVFHFIIFPSSLVQYLAGGLTVEAYNSLNWVFEPDYAMIRILDELFPALVMRAGIIFGIETVLILLAGILMNRRGRKLDQAGIEIVEVRNVSTEERYVAVEDAPDLVLQHRLQNSSLKQKKKLMEELRKTPEELQKEAEEKAAEAEQERAEEKAEETSEPQTENGAAEQEVPHEEISSGDSMNDIGEENPEDDMIDALPGTGPAPVREKLTAGENETVHEQMENRQKAEDE